MKMKTNVWLNFKNVYAILAMVVVTGSAQAAWLTPPGATVGDSYAAGNGYDYDATANWLSGSIDDNFSTLGLTGALTISLDAARTTGAGGLNLTLTGASDFSILSDGTTSREITLGGNVTADVTDGSQAITIGTSGRPVTLNLNNSTRTFTVGSGDTLQINGVISSTTAASGKLTKDGAGKLILAATPTYTGATTINAGTLQLGNGGATGILNAGSPIVNNGSLVINHASAQTLAVISGTGSVTNLSAALTLNTGNTFSGGFTMNGGSLTGIAAGTYGGFGSGTVTMPTGAFINFNSGSPAVTINNDLNWGGNFIFTRSSNGTPTSTWNGTLTLSNNLGIQLGAATTSANAIFTNNISGGFGITFTTLGNVNPYVTLSGANNTFSGGLNINMPTRVLTLNINSATALGATAGTLTIGSTSVIDNTSAAAITLTNNNPLAINANFTFTGTRDLNMGTGTVNLGGGTRTITTTAGILTLGGVISNGGITKAGAGTLTLTGNNTFTGTTTINAGTIVLNNDGDVTGSTVSFNGNNTVLTVTGGSGVTSIWNAGGGALGTSNIAGTGLQFTIDGAGTAGSARVTNVGILSWGRANTTGTLLLTNGGQMNVNGEVRTGGTYYGGVGGTGGANITIQGGSATSTFTGNSGQAFYIGYGERAGANNNIVTVSSGGVLMSIGNMFVGDLNYNGTPNGIATANNLTVSGTGTASMASITVGNARQAAASSAVNANALLVTGGGTLTTSGINYIGRAYIASSIANANTATVTGSGSSWNAGAQTVYVGHTANATATANNNILTVASSGVLSNVSSLIVGFGTGTETGNKVVLNGGSITATSVTVSTGNSLEIGANGGTLSGNIVNNGTLSSITTVPVSLAGVISGSGTLAQNGSGITTLSGVNTYSGTTTISDGTLNASVASALGGGNVTVTGGMLVIGHATAMAPTATLTLPSLTAANITLSANATVAKLFIGGVQQPNGIYSGTAWISGSGTLTVGSAGAQPSYWDSNDVAAGAGTTPTGTWGSDSYWNATADGTTTTPASWTAGRTAAFAAGTDASGTYTVTVSGAQDIGGLTFEEGTVTLSGGTALRLISDSLAYVATNMTATVETPITEDTARTLTKAGAGLLTLSSANTYTGVTTVNGGTLNLAGNRTAAAGAITVQNGATLGVSNGNFSLQGNNFMLGAVTGNSTVNHTAGTISFSNSTGGNQLLVGNGNSSSGTYNLSGGTLKTSFSSSYSRGVMLGVNGGSPAVFNLSGTGNLDMTSLGNSSLQIGRSDSSAHNTTTLFNQTGGTAAIGILTMGGASGGSTNVNATLTVTDGTFTANSFTVLAAGNYNTAILNIGGTANVTLPAFPTARGTSSTATINFDGGTLKNAATGTFITSDAKNTVYIKAGGATFDTGLNSTTISQALLTHGVSTGGGLTKAGANTLTLTGVNTYTGATTINGGTLKLDTTGTIANSTNIIIGTGAGLDVSTLTTALTLTSGQTLKASATGANPTATITVASGKNLTLSAGGLDFTAYAGGATAPLTLAGAAGELAMNSAPVRVTTTATLANGSYTLVAKGTPTVTGTLGALTVNGVASPTWATVEVTAGELILTITDMPAITTSGSLTGMTTTYGTASTAQSFFVSGANMAAGITVTPPAGFEVSQTSGTTGFAGSGTAITVGSSGTIASTEVWVRLAATASVAGSPYSGNVVCSSSGAVSINVATASSTVSALALTITANNQNKTYGSTQSSPVTLSTNFVSSGLQNGETIGTVTLTYDAGGLAATDATGSTSVITPSDATGGTFTASNYSITYNTGTLTVTPAILTVTADNKARYTGDANPSLTYTITGYQNGENFAGIGVTGDAPTLGTTAVIDSLPGTYPITVTPGTWASGNYDFSYAPGTLTVNPRGTLIQFMAE